MLINIIENEEHCSLEGYHEMMARGDVEIIMPYEEIVIYGNNPFTVCPICRKELKTTDAGKPRIDNSDVENGA